MAAHKKRKRTDSIASSRELEREHAALVPLADRLAVELERQLARLTDDARISLTFPIQRRVKQWESIGDKITRKALRLNRITDLKDLVGLRLVLQFSRDVDKVCDLISKSFVVIERQDTSERLASDQFGYSSVHFLVTMPDEWSKVPTLAPLKGLKAEIQVRTTAQHIWAAASHTLQYKQEESVPPPVRRAIYRVSALLEMVDLEFERVLEAREEYRREIAAPTGPLNVDSLARTLTEVLPEENRDKNEDFDDLLRELLAAGIAEVDELTGLLRKHLPAVVKEDMKHVRLVRADPEDASDEENERANRGAYFTYTGLVRRAISKELGEQWWLK